MSCTINFWIFIDFEATLISLKKNTFIYSLEKFLEESNLSFCWVVVIVKWLAFSNSEHLYKMRKCFRHLGTVFFLLMYSSSLASVTLFLLMCYLLRKKLKPPLIMFCWIFIINIFLIYVFWHYAILYLLCEYFAFSFKHVSLCCDYL